jgi:hypothetical protein
VRSSRTKTDLNIQSNAKQDQFLKKKPCLEREGWRQPEEKETACEVTTVRLVANGLLTSLH